ncbi:hypothetical protein V1508DRAFT_427220 [Lipomyces doorenjongii]|uniref:uncharacterized protein n=1 Tax=Lipomyces doorenjongii TaxID=383834 RepID=UPI0034CFF116
MTNAKLVSAALMTAVITSMNCCIDGKFATSTSGRCKSGDIMILSGSKANDLWKRASADQMPWQTASLYHLARWCPMIDAISVNKTRSLAGHGV